MQRQRQRISTSSNGVQYYLEGKGLVKRIFNWKANIDKRKGRKTERREVGKGRRKRRKRWKKRMRRRNGKNKRDE